MSTGGYLILLFVFFVFLFDALLDVLDLFSLGRCKSADDIGVYDEKQFRRMVSYQKDKLVCRAVRKLVNGVVLIALFVLGFVKYVAVVLESGVCGLFWKTVIMFVIIEGIVALVGAFFDALDTFEVEKRHGFYTGGLTVFLRDMFISSFLGGVVLVLVLGVVVLFVDLSHSKWWVYVALFISMFNVFVVYIYPSFVAPLFYKFHELESVELRERIERLFDMVGSKLRGIYVMEASKKSKHTNAYFAGVGNKKRVVLFDTLIESLSVDEIVCVFAHELGHYKLGHIPKMIFVSTVVVFVVLYMSYGLVNLKWMCVALGLPYNFPCSLLVVFMIVSAALFLVNPLVMAISRKHEFDADRYAVDVTGTPHSFIRALTELYKDNAVNPCPHPLSVVFRYSHPPILLRLRKLEECKGMK